MLSANQIAGVLNQLFLQGKSTKQPHFLYVDTNSQKSKVVQKFLVGHDQNMSVAKICLWALKLTVSQEGADEINRFFACRCKLM